MTKFCLSQLRLMLYSAFCYKKVCLSRFFLLWLRPTPGPIEGDTTASLVANRTRKRTSNEVASEEGNVKLLSSNKFSAATVCRKIAWAETRPAEAQVIRVAGDVELKDLAEVLEDSGPKTSKHFSNSPTWHILVHCEERSTTFKDFKLLKEIST